ncbi:MAG: mono/diheme cytochrome c family protein [Pseudohongiellaceae bacterium]|jgi:mono/diheme cytochrome c family protein
MHPPLSITLRAAIAALALTQTAPAQDGQLLFAQHCAKCHGETGDGNGTEELDRPARSFQDGGFSFGDTELAIFRTITHGIPGSPMPSFGDGLSDDQRQDLAVFVRTLCPPRAEVTEEDTAMVVGDFPLVAKGLLSPVVSGAQTYPRGLLLGTTDGLTFEYRADDLRLLAVRQGPFAQRNDWTGRGGAPLVPLGSVVWLNEEGSPPGLFFAESQSAEGDDIDRTDGTVPDRQPLQVDLTSISTPRSGASITSTLRDANDRPVGQVTEEPRRLTTSLGSGFSRRFTITANSPDVPLVLLMPWVEQPDSERTAQTQWIAPATDSDRAGADASYDTLGELRVITWSAGVSPLTSKANAHHFGELSFMATHTNLSCTIELMVLPLAQWPDDPAALSRELLR